MLGEYLKRARFNKNISQRELAKLVDKSNAYISKIEKGIIVSPNPLVLQKIIECLDLDYYHVMKLAGYIAEAELISVKHAFRNEQIKNWLTSKKNITDMKLDYKFFTAHFDVYLISNEEEFLLKVIDSFVSEQVLVHEIKSLVLDLIVANKRNVELDVIIQMKNISEDKNKIISRLSTVLSYLPLKINYFAL